MMIKRRFQSRIAKGKSTLPIAILLAIVCWVIVYSVKPDSLVKKPAFPLWQMLHDFLPNEFAGTTISFILYSLIGYLLIELNNAYSIIRMRASVQTSLFLIIVATCPELYPLQAGTIAALTLLTAIYFLFKCYQQVHPVNYMFFGYFFIGLGSLVFPKLIFFIPIFIIGAYNFQALSARTFFAGIIGFSIPYWFLFGHAFFYNQMELFYQPFIELITFPPADYKAVQLWEIITVGFSTALLLISSIHSFATSYLDKIRTRSYLNFFILLEIGTLILMIFLPAQATDFFPILFSGVSILAGHLFALTDNKVSNLFFMFTLISLTALFVFNLWML